MSEFSQDPTLSLVLRSWSWEPAILIGIGLGAAGYAYGFYHFSAHGWLLRMTRRGLIHRKHPWFFTAGLIALAIALLSPIATLAGMLLWSHMLQHILLIMVAPPLILFGLPSPMLRWLILKSRLRGVVGLMTMPLLAFAIYNINLLVWHLPAFYEAALSSSLIHSLEHMLFLGTAMLFWWRILDPTKGWFPLWQSPAGSWIYLLLAAPFSYILGSILWVHNQVFYPTYLAVPRLWGLSALADQQTAGMLMWVQGWMFIMASMIVFFSWYNPEVEQA